MNNVVLILVVFLFAGCSNVDDNDSPKPIGIELSHRMIFLRESSHSELHGTGAYDLPYKDTIRIKSSTGGYSIAKVKSTQNPTGLITKIKTEIVVTKDSLIVVSISGPTKSEYDTNDRLVPHCEDIYLLTNKDGQKISFGIRDIYRVDMPDISLVRPIKEIFLEQLDSYCH